MKLAFLAAPFLGETVSAGFQKPGEEKPAADKKTLSFGPIQTPKGLRIENITRGTDDRTEYVPGQLYDVPVLASTWKDNIYFRTAGGSTLTADKPKK